MSTDTATAATVKPAATPHVSLAHTDEKRNWTSTIILTLYILFLMVPVYWLIITSMKDNLEIMTSFSVVPQNWTFKNYHTIFTDESWYSGYVNSAIYVVMNTVISIVLALPAAYAFSRYRFLGDKHAFFWFFTNRMSPPAVFALPFFQLYSASA